MAKDTSFLEFIGSQYRVTVKVPRHLREIVGKAHLRHPLHTGSLARANALKHGVIHQLKGIIQDAEERYRGTAGSQERTRIHEAMEWRHDLRRAHEADREDPEAEAWDITTSLLADRAEEIAEAEGLPRAQEFHAIATGKATPITALVDQWIAERPMKPRQVTDYRRAVSKFTAWLAQGRHPEAIERVTRRIAGSYISEAFVKAGVHPRTANKDISCLASLWKWSERKGIVNENVWKGQSLAKPQPTKAEAKRPFTDKEVETLFTGEGKTKTTQLLRDFMTIAALSGMRVEEIARLTAGDIHGECFDITKAKSRAGVRMVPIHPALAEIVTRRTTGRKPTETLWPELPEPKPGSPIEKSQKVVKQFTTYRRRLGVDDTPEGARQSRVDFHSWRRTFVTKAERAGNQPHLIEALVGHKRAGMTVGLYSGGPLIEQLRAVVESVKLKPLTVEGSPEVV